MDCGMLVSSVLHCQSLLRFMAVESVMLSNHLMFCRPLLFLPSLFLSIRRFALGQVSAELYADGRVLSLSSSLFSGHQPHNF